jgi:hypothetical protein
VGFKAELNEPTRRCPTELLHFAKHNPRLLTGDDLKPKTDAEIISVLNRISPLEELIMSISSNTFLDLEPLIVIGKEQGPFEVLEGNRRLASIKLLLNPKLAAECKISLPEKISKEVKESLKQVTVWRVKSEDDAKAFIGFKHINGPHRWDAYAKAKFVTEWHRENSVSIDEIARQLGDDNDTIRSFIAGILVLEQAESKKLFKISNRYNNGRFAFSHLYTALGRKEYQKFLGLKTGWNHKLKKNPIPTQAEKKLAEVLLYLYGNKTDTIKPLVETQNPDLKYVGEVLSHPVALEKIRAGATLTDARNEVRPPYEVFGEALAHAHQKLSQAVDALPKYNGEKKLISIADEIVEKADTLRTLMLKKQKTSKKG